MALSITLVGGPTAVLDLDGFRIVTDPTFDPPGEYPQPGMGFSLVKTAGPALTVEEIAPVHLALASHEHEDNLDRAGREFLASTPLAFTTPVVAAGFGDNVVGLEDHCSAKVSLPGGGAVTVTAVPAHHGPEGVRELGGPVSGYVLRGPTLPTIYVSGDNSDVDLVRDIHREYGPIDVAVLFAGGAGFESIANGADLTLGNEAALQVAEILQEATIVPVHTDSWAHFRQSVDDMKAFFTTNGRGEQLLVLTPGETVEWGGRFKDA